MAFEAFHSPKVKIKGDRPYSPAVRAGDWLLISGQVSVDGEGNTVGKGDTEAQLRQCFENIKALVEEAGATMADVAQIRIYATDMGEFLRFHEMRREYFSPPYPSATGVEISGLADPDWLIEVEAAAYLGGG